MIDERGMLFIDNSTLKAVAACSTQALMRYVYHYTSREESMYFKQGSVGHEALAAYFKGAAPDVAMEMYRQGYEEWADANVPPDDRLTFSNTSKIMRHWFKTHPLVTLPFTFDPELVEVGFQVPLTEGITFYGRADAIPAHRNGGALVVLDNKFTGRINAQWIKNWRMDSQLTGYIWAVGEKTGEVIDSAYLNVIETAKLPSDPVRKCAKHGTRYEECGVLHAQSEIVGPIMRSEYKIDQWKATTIKQAEKFKRLAEKFPTIEYVHRVPQEGMYHGACGYCQFHDFCTIDRNVERVDQLLTIEPWSPFEIESTKP